MNFDLAALLQSSGLPPSITAAILHVFSTLFALALVARTFRPWVVKGFTWLADRLDDMAGRGRSNGAVLLAIVDSRIYVLLWFLVDLMLRVHLPTRASILARWTKLEEEQATVELMLGGTKSSDDIGHLPAFAFLCVIGSLLFTACVGHLDPKGLSAGDQILYTAEKTTTGAYETLHTFVAWEHDNRAALQQWPEITRAADNIRLHAEDWIDTAIDLTEAYRLKPDETQRAKLESALRLLRTGLADATKYLPPAKK